MANFSIVLVLGVFFSIAGHMVIADDTTQEMPEGGLSRVSATNSWETDEVGFLQAEVVAQSSTSKVEVDEIGERKGNRICQDLSDNTFTPDMSCVPLARDELPKTVPSIEQMPTNLHGDDVLEERTPPKEESVKATSSPAGTSTSVLNWCLDILVFVVIVDGLRRWRYKDQSGSNETSVVDGWQKLMQAALAGDTVRFESLLIGGIDVTRTDSWGCTLVHAAAKGGSTQILSQLLKHGGKVDDIDAWDETPLHLAARAGHTDVCELLIVNGASINVPNAENWTPLLVAAHDGRKTTCKVLLNRGANAGGLSNSELPPMLTGLLMENTGKHEKLQLEPGDPLLWQVDGEDQY